MSSSALIASFIVPSILIAGCGGHGTKSAGGGGGSTAQASHLYLADYGGGSGQIFQFAVTNTGIVSPLSPATITTDAKTDIIAIDPLSKYLFSSIDGNPSTIGQFVIGGDGTLTANVVPTVGSDNLPGGSAFTPDGAGFFVSNFTANTLRSYTVGSTGALTSVMSLNTGAGAQQVAIDKTGAYAYVTNYFSGSVSKYFISSNGMMAGNGTTGVGTNPYGMAITPNNLFAYVCNRGDGTVQQFGINPANGNLTDNGGAILTGNGAGSEPDYVVVESTGKYAYVACDGGSGAATVTAYTIGLDGKLTKNGADMPVGTATSFEFLAIDPSSHFLAAFSLSTSNLFIFSINANGTLTQVGSPTVVASGNIAGMAFGK